MAKSYLDKDGLLYFLQSIRPNATPSMDGSAATGTSKRFALQDHVHPSDSTKVDKDGLKVLSDNNFTDALKTKLDGIATGAEVNVQVDWNEADSSSDAYIKNKPTIPSGVEKTTTTPKMDGTAAVGSETKFAAGDHVHPSDTSRVPTTRTVNGHALSADVTVTAADVSAIPTSAKGAASGVCPLNASSKVDSTYLPSYVDDVIEAYPRTGQTELSSTWLSETSVSGSALTPESGKIYILMSDSTNYAAYTQFRYSGSAYVKMLDGGVTAITNAEIDTIVAS